MRIILIFLILILTRAIYAQESSYTTHEVFTTVVFPGCEKVPQNDKTALTKCMATEINAKLADQLSNLSDKMDSLGIETATAKLQFVVNQSGKISEITALKGGNQILSDAAVLGMNKIAQQISPIVPAKLENGNPVNLLFQLPVKFQVLKEDTNSQANAKPYPVDEIVLFSLEDHDLRYEIRLYKDKYIKCYEVKNGKENFLGRYLNLTELEMSEPYLSLIERVKNSNKTLLTDGYLDDEFFEIYIHNLFNRTQENPIYVEVLEVDKEKRTLVSTFEKEEEFNRSKFAPLIYRN